MYLIIIGKNTTELVMKTNSKIREGYTPLGGPIISKNGHMLQAVFKDKN